MTRQLARGKPKLSGYSKFIFPYDQLSFSSILKLVNYSGKEVHISDGEKEVAHSYLGMDLSKHSYTLGQICLFKVLD